MSSEWREITFGDFVALQRGHDLPDQERRPGKVPILGSFGVTGFHDTIKAKGPGVTIGRSGASFGVAAYTDEDYWPLNTTLYVTDFKGNDPKFVFYFLKLFDFSAYNSGSAQPSLNRNNLYGIPIEVPSPSTQKQIAAFVSALDDRIALLRETNATLEAIAQALFKSWFVDFDPVHAKQQGRAPEGLDEATAALFPDSFEESVVGLVPNGWRTCSFTDTIDVIGGGTPKTSVAEYWNGEIPWFSVVDAPSPTDVFVIDTEKHITSYGLNNSSTKLLPPGTTIISARGTVGRLALVGQEMAMNQSCYGLRGKGSDDYFTYFSTYRLVETLKQRTHGSVFDTITRDTLAGVFVVYPPIAVIAAFEDLLKPVMERIKENLQQAQTLSTLRDTLLPRLISGQLRLPEAEALVVDAA